MVEAATLCSRILSALAWYCRSRSEPSSRTGKARTKRKSAHHHDEARRGLKPAIVRRGKFHLHFGALARLVDEVVGDALLHGGVGHSDVMPGLGVGAWRRIARRLQHPLAMFARAR